jgi:hypothetical protein
VASARLYDMTLVWIVRVRGILFALSPMSFTDQADPERPMNFPRKCNNRLSKAAAVKLIVGRLMPPQGAGEVAAVASSWSRYYSWWSL